MTLSQITAEGVYKAINEFDHKGREPFLKEYGYGKARSYFLVHNSRHYDSKAIAGVAHGYDLPEIGPLTSEEFTGGESSVARKLESLGFTVENASSRNPPWSRDELILALDFYRVHQASIPGQESNEIAELSQAINQLQALTGEDRSETFRNPNGVYMKLMNFRRFDPEFTSEGKVGLQRGGKGDEQVWTEFWDDPRRLERTANLIHGLVDSGTQIERGTSYPVADPIAEAPEGRLITVEHTKRERSTKLIKDKKRSFEKEHGRLFCEACGFDFNETYGDRGAGFIECHHTKPVSELKPGEKTKLVDLRLLCANCHRMVHAKAPWLRMSELRKLLH